MARMQVSCLWSKGNFKWVKNQRQQVDVFMTYLDKKNVTGSTTLLFDNFIHKTNKIFYFKMNIHTSK